jgi:PIN domain nuclease of toxin-antitoxin system
MNLLLDTHIALWVIADDARLSQKARDLILAPKNSVWVSAVSIWEIAIKFGLGRSSTRWRWKICPVIIKTHLIVC